MYLHLHIRQRHISDFPQTRFNVLIILSRYMKLIRAVGRAALVLHDHALLLIGQRDQILRDLIRHGDR